ncbi:MAG TPA: glucose-6-phosphate isomerase family protein [Candidatus Acidoferrum sp.]|nr:glucose-6-phosphate isomerase family protein [Candidatus Acidoferrum sp.]
MLGVPMLVDLRTGELRGDAVLCVTRTIKDMKGSYRDERARQSLAQDMVVYRVQAFHPVGEDNEGGLFWGTTFLEPGMIGDEYFMTKGHHHAKRSRSEFYLTLAGSGALILMDEQRRTVFEPMSVGTLHYVPSYTAHRVANTGDSLLTVLACWPSDSGHDYEAIGSQGFSARLRNVGGMPVLVEEP